MAKLTGEEIIEQFEEFIQQKTSHYSEVASKNFDDENTRIKSVNAYDNYNTDIESEVNKIYSENPELSDFYKKQITEIRKKYHVSI